MRRRMRKGRGGDRMRREVILRHFVTFVCDKLLRS